MIVWWVIALVAGIGVAAIASRHAVDHAIQISEDLGISAGLVGVTIVAIGTDLPEIANSISASISGHGDLNVGDSTGSTLTQVTLILAILVLASPTLREAGNDDQRSIVVPTGVMTVAATLLIAVLISDEQLGRADGLLLVAVWALGMVLASRLQHSGHLVSGTRRTVRKRTIAKLGAWLAIVGGAATVVVQAFVRLTEEIGVPELVAGTVVLALGTSLPELVVDWTALRRGAAALAVGDLFGSSLVDATLSIGIGPTIRSTAVSADAVGSVLVVAGGVAMATLVWRLRPANALVPALQLLAIYVGCTVAIIWLTAA